MELVCTALIVEHTNEGVWIVSLRIALEKYQLIGKLAIIKCTLSLCMLSLQN